ncbi:LMxysn_1693 family intestinal colonization protein [Bacillus cereus]|uniref:LMxysn_1693 family intestinal colonization protein n=1 Tax=Bacillus cereus TaxID=1396 RepID=UPI00067EA903|nr:hypothetical protein [Bacillus cereus]
MNEPGIEIIVENLGAYSLIIDKIELIPIQGTAFELEGKQNLEGFFADNTYAAEVHPSNGTEFVKPLCATCNQYKGYIKYSNILSHEYLGTVTTTSGWLTNTGFTMYGINFGGGKTYSQSRNFKEYRVKRQYFMHFDVYNAISKKIDSFETARTETTIEYERA